MSAADSAASAADAARTAGKGLGIGSLTAGAADLIEGNGFDRFGNVVAEAARRGGDVLAAVGDLVNRVTPDFLSDLIPKGAGSAADAVGVFAPYTFDALVVIL